MRLEIPAAPTTAPTVSVPAPFLYATDVIAATSLPRWAAATRSRGSDATRSPLLALRRRLGLLMPSMESSQGIWEVVVKPAACSSLPRLALVGCPCLNAHDIQSDERASVKENDAPSLRHPNGNRPSQTLAAQHGRAPDEDPERFQYPASRERPRLPELETGPPPSRGGLNRLVL